MSLNIFGIYRRLEVDSFYRLRKMVGVDTFINILYIIRSFSLIFNFDKSYYTEDEKENSNSTKIAH